MTSTPERFPIVALRPIGALDQASSSEFRVALEQALEQAEMVIVDLLWVEQIDETGIADLLGGIEQAGDLGKLLSFQSMDRHTHAALEQAWNQQEDLGGAGRSHWFKQDLELFLKGGGNTASLKTSSG